MDEQGTVSVASHREICARDLLTAFLKDVKYVKCFGELGHVQDSECTIQVDPDFPYAWPDRSHRLPVAWIATGLHAPKLIARVTPGIIREEPQVSERAGDPDDRLLTHRQLYTYVYVRSTRLAAAGSASMLGTTPSPHQSAKTRAGKVTSSRWNDDGPGASRCYRGGLTR